MNGADTVAVFEQVGGKTVAKGMATNPLGDIGGSNCAFDGFLQPAFMEVMATNNTAAGIFGEVVSREDELLAPLSVCVRILSL